MTHEKFIESLNLYLDGELPPPEAAVLEREIAGNLEYRRIYRHYCQMQNACGELAERFRDEAAPAPHFRRGEIVELPQRRASSDWFRSIALVASGAAAACVVFVAVRQTSPSATAPAMVQNQPAAAVAPGTGQPVPFTMAVALTGNPVGFRNPWTPANREVVDFSRLSASNKPLMFSAPELNNAPGGDSLQVDLQPYGTTPNAPLRMEEIQAAAFQYQR